MLIVRQVVLECNKFVNNARKLASITKALCVLSKGSSLMKRFTLFAMTVLVTFGAVADEVEISSIVQQRLSENEALGHYLFEKIRTKDEYKAKNLANYKELKKVINGAKCSGLKYRYFISEDAGTLFVIGTTRKKNVAVIGRHYYMPIVEGRAAFETIGQSTRTCFAMEFPKSVLELHIRHVLDDYPSEFHVLANLLTGVRIFLITDLGRWVVENGKISFISKGNT